MTSKLKTLVGAALMLNLFDAGATLFILDKGGTEVNPLMDYLINVSPWLFVTVKVVVFAFAIIVMARLSPRYVKWVVRGYSLLAMWHCYLLWSTYLFSLGQLVLSAALL
tara:strand:+ start:2817 stop:3143 length:327 start_codon:yes stop_codon:yes gene_type:complete